MAGHPPFTPSPGHVIGGGSWPVLAGLGGSFWQVPTLGTRHFRRGGGGGLGCHLAGFPRYRKIKFFASFSLITWHLAYILAIIFSSWHNPSFWCKCNHWVMATFSCVALKAASAAHRWRKAVCLGQEKGCLSCSLDADSLPVIDWLFVHQGKIQALFSLQMKTGCLSWIRKRLFVLQLRDRLPASVISWLSVPQVRIGGCLSCKWRKAVCLG